MRRTALVKPLVKNFHSVFLTLWLLLPASLIGQQIQERYSYKKYLDSLEARGLAEQSASQFVVIPVRKADYEDPRQYVRALLGLAETFKRHDWLDSALHYAILAREGAEFIGDASSLFAARLFSGDVAMLLYDYPLALSNYSSAMNIAGGLGREKEILMQVKLAEFNRSQREFTQGLALLKSIESDPVLLANDSLRLYFLGRKTALLSEAKESEEALETVREAKKLARKVGHTADLASILNDYGFAQENLFHLDSAIHYYKIAETSHVLAGDARGALRARTNFARVLGKQEKYYEAIDALNGKFEEAVKNQWRREAMHIGQILGDAYFQLGLYEKGLAYFIMNNMLDNAIWSKENDQLIKSIESEMLRAKFEKEVAEKDLELQEQLAEQEYLKRIQYSILMLVIFLAVLTVVILYSRNQMQQKNALLERSKEKLASNNAELHKALDQNVLLVKEIHHRVKNNLQMISSMLNLHARKMKDGPAKRALQEGEARVKSIALLHKHLYQGEEVKDVEMQPYLKQLITNIRDSVGGVARHIKTTVKAEGVTLNVDQAIPLVLIVNECITNAFKYAFRDRDSGHIQILLQWKFQQLEMIVRDDGVGYEETDEVQESFGWQLVKLMTEQLNGTFRYKNEGGLKLSFTFDLYRYEEANSDSRG